MRDILWLFTSDGAKKETQHHLHIAALFWLYRREKCIEVFLLKTFPASNIPKEPKRISAPPSAHFKKLNATTTIALTPVLIVGCMTAL
jgi:hypothetical protein